MQRSNVSSVPSQRSFPQVSIQRSSASAESQVGTWTPLVMWPTGTSSSGQRGKSGWKMCRLTCPCRRLTPLTAPQPRIARYAMLKSSDASSGFRRPSARKSRSDMPSRTLAYRVRYCSMSG